jgi:hypothetical protein
MKNLKILLIFSFLLIYNFGYSWGTTGHRVVAQIAQNHLSSKAKREIKKIFGNEPMAYWANWPDFIKSDTTGVWKASSEWHYIDVDKQNNFKDFVTAIKGEKAPNLYTQIQILSAQLKDEKTAMADKKIALIFLIHLLGDSSQPMHTGRHEDLGGNKIKVKFFGQDTNLHALWDSKLIDFTQYSYSEFAKVLDVKTPEEVKQIQSGTLEDWLYDSHKQANYIYANSVAGKSYSYDYNYKFESILERQLLYGGLRLAKVLNDIF